MSAVNTRSKSKTIEDVLAGIEELRPLIEENAAKGEADRQVPDEVISALEGTGALSITTPKRFGGLELTLEDKLAVSAAVGRIDGSTAWCVGLINVCAWLASLLPDSAQQKIWGANPDAHVAGVLNP